MDPTLHNAELMIDWDKAAKEIKEREATRFTLKEQNLPQLIQQAHFNNNNGLMMKLEQKMNRKTFKEFKKSANKHGQKGFRAPKGQKGFAKY